MNTIKFNACELILLLFITHIETDKETEIGYTETLRTYMKQFKCYLCLIITFF